MVLNKQDLIVSGRLAEYRYYDMHQVIGYALLATRNLFNSQDKFKSMTLI